MKSTLLALLISAAFAVAQTNTPACSVATLSGTHSLVLTGRNVASLESPGGGVTGASVSQAFFGVGTATFDGAGNVSFNLTFDTFGGGATQLWSGTYALPSSCLGTLTIATPNMASFTLVPYNSGKDFTLTGANSMFSFTGSGAQQPSACVPASLSGDYAFTGNGFAAVQSILTGPGGTITGVNAITGLMTFDGVSAVTANWTISTSTNASSDTLTGSYTVQNSSCTATATLTDSNGESYSLIITITAPTANTFSAVISNGGTFLSSATGHSTFTNPGVAVELAAGDGLPIPLGSLFSIYGLNLATGQASLTGFPMPDTLASASVTVNGEQVPLYFVEKTLINAQMPLDITPGVATLVVKNGTNSNAVAINVAATAAPGVFADTLSHAEAQNLPSYDLNSSSDPAPVGSAIVVYFTGGGPVQGQSSLVTGHATPDAQFPVTETYSVTLDGVQAKVDYIGLVPTAVGGFYQANIVIPNIPAGAHSLVITINGQASNTTTVNTK